MTAMKLTSKLQLYIYLSFDALNIMSDIHRGTDCGRHHQSVAAKTITLRIFKSISRYLSAKRRLRIKTNESNIRYCIEIGCVCSCCCCYDENLDLK